MFNEDFFFREEIDFSSGALELSYFPFFNGICVSQFVVFYVMFLLLRLFVFVVFGHVVSGYTLFCTRMVMEFVSVVIVNDI